MHPRRRAQRRLLLHRLLLRLPPQHLLLFPRSPLLLRLLLRHLNQPRLPKKRRPSRSCLTMN